MSSIAINSSLRRKRFFQMNQMFGEWQLFPPTRYSADDSWCRAYFALSHILPIIEREANKGNRNLEIGNFIVNNPIRSSLTISHTLEGARVLTTVNLNEVSDRAVPRRVYSFEGLHCEAYQGRWAYICELRPNAVGVKIQGTRSRTYPTLETHWYGYRDGTPPDVAGNLFSLQVVYGPNRVETHTLPGRREKTFPEGEKYPRPLLVPRAKIIGRDIPWEISREKYAQFAAQTLRISGLESLLKELRK